MSLVSAAPLLAKPMNDHSPPLNLATVSTPGKSTDCIPEKVFAVFLSATLLDSLASGNVPETN